MDIETTLQRQEQYSWGQIGHYLRIASGRIAVFIAEPIGGVGALTTPPSEYLRIATDPRKVLGWHRGPSRLPSMGR